MKYRYRLKWTAWLAAVGAAAFVSPALAMNLGLITGPPTGTGYQCGLDLQELMKSQGVDVAVHPSAGSVENIYAVYQRAGVHLGIVQSDVLALVAKVRTNPALRRIAQKIKVVYPLYDEEIHLLGKDTLQSLEDLQGKRVAIDAEGSGTALTAKLLCEMTQIKPAQLVSMSPEDALQGIKAGALDAMFLVAGAPVKLFQDNVKAEDHLRLIPIVHKHVFEFYPQAVIPAGTYPWQKAAVTTAAVKAVLITYDYRLGQCLEIGRFARIVEEHQQWLRTHGHPKWKTVDFSLSLPGWEKSSCLPKTFGSISPRDVPDTKEVNPVLEVIRDLF